MTGGKLLSVTELAMAWGWSESRVKRAIRAKRIPFVRIGGKYYFREAVLERWLEEQEAVNAGGKTKPRSTRERHEADCARLNIEPYHEFSGVDGPPT